MLKYFVSLTFVAVLVGLTIVTVKLWAGVVTFDFRPIIAIFGIATMFMIGAIGWRKMNEVTRRYLMVVLVIGTLMILISVYK